MHFARMMAISIVLLTLTACQMNVSMYDGPDAGYAVASIAVETRSTYMNVQLDFRSSDGKDDSYLFWVNDEAVLAPAADFRSAQEHGGVATLRLRPGRYEFYSFGVSAPGMGYQPRIAFSVPIVIEAGKVSYLGQYLTLGLPKEGLFGGEVQGAPYFVISNQQSRDIPLAAKHTPALAGLPVVTRVPNPATLGVPYFRSAPIPRHSREGDPD
jgi:hypothetical protein